MLIGLFFFVLVSSVIANEKDGTLPRLNDSKAAEAFIKSAEVVVIGFLEGAESHGYKELVAAAKRVDSVPVAISGVKEVWADYGIKSDTITLFRKADNHQENLVVPEAKKLETDGLVNFFIVNEVRYVTEYSQVTAVGIFNSEVKTHLLLFANRGSKEYAELKEQLAALAPEFTGQDLPRVGIYDGDSDMKWLLPEGSISTERVREFCQSFLRGELKDVTQAGAEGKTEL
ncbi:endoplasmic reticulum resident protein 27 isoform X3 [Dunckerocampus dactyliophorus]|uniref:endoplasmic reticulum resident protein 27 isoform X3 n=1 Tax=Dunckerocampus dactyliophorus TaxID=161453 RepID=UPI0024051F2A|nr:endoplasmic reticulum resident protein 27 isoform X3 [Dunckerocampus dactyliophorus]